MLTAYQRHSPAEELIPVPERKKHPAQVRKKFSDMLNVDYKRQLHVLTDW